MLSNLFDLLATVYQHRKIPTQPVLAKCRYLWQGEYGHSQTFFHYILFSIHALTTRILFIHILFVCILFIRMLLIRIFFIFIIFFSFVYFFICILSVYLSFVHSQTIAKWWQGFLTLVNKVKIQSCRRRRQLFRIVPRK